MRQQGKPVKMKQEKRNNTENKAWKKTQMEEEDTEKEKEKRV